MEHIYSTSLKLNHTETYFQESQCLKDNRFVSSEWTAERWNSEWSTSILFAIIDPREHHAFILSYMENVIDVSVGESFLC